MRTVKISTIILHKKIWFPLNFYIAGEFSSMLSQHLQIQNLQVTMLQALHFFLETQIAELVGEHLQQKLMFCMWPLRPPPPAHPPTGFSSLTCWGFPLLSRCWFVLPTLSSHLCLHNVPWRSSTCNPQRVPVENKSTCLVIQSGQDCACGLRRTGRLSCAHL